ncbi:hypothetical protein [Colwellia sp. KU-HH00111]|uniref:hypothetical protein n=1 Tax=Colwellia sp. KU-HH00111 TaxID=3127652 RepID=UPI0033659A7F
MNNKHRLLIGFCMVATVVSCSQSEPDNVSENNNRQQQVQTPVKDNSPSKPIAIKATKHNVIKPNLSGKTTISVNGDKFIVEGGNLRKGSRVRSIHMSEYGTVTGAFVVVAKPGKIPNLSFKRKTKIAKDTFRVIPTKTDDLMSIYHELLLNESISIVELEISYQGKKSDAAHY